MLDIANLLGCFEYARGVVSTAKCCTLYLALQKLDY